MHSHLAGIAVIGISIAFFSLHAGASSESGAMTPKRASKEPPAVSAGEGFTQAHARLIKSGWHPVDRHRHDSYEYSGTEKELKHRGYAEVDSCSVDAGVRCILYYKKDGQCLRIDTIGEQVDRMKVIRSDDECPEA